MIRNKKNLVTNMKPSKIMSDLVSLPHNKTNHDVLTKMKQLSTLRKKKSNFAIFGLMFDKPSTTCL